MDGRLIEIVAEAAAPGLETRRLIPPMERTASSFSSKWSGTVGGAPIPVWWATDLTISGNAFDVYSLNDACYVPKAGAVLTKEGGLLQSASLVSYIDPKYENLTRTWSTRGSAPRLSKGIVVMSWGANNNFGHFVLDTMTSVLAIAEEDDACSFVTPPLHDWQRQYFALFGVQPIELADPIYSFERLSLNSGMRGALHKPNSHFAKFRDAALAKVPTGADGPARIYVSRRGQKRTMVNEAEFEARLEALGFAVVRPQEMSVAQQIKTFRDAKVIVAPTGAALANLIFARGATVFEIIPRDMTTSDPYHKWVAYLSAMGEGDWRPFFCDDLPGSEQPEIAGRRLEGYKPFEAPVEELIAFIEPAL